MSGVDLNAIFRKQNEDLAERDRESWIADDWRWGLQWWVPQDLRLPFEEYRCPNCGGGHTRGWTCLPWKQEIPHVEMEC